MYFAGFRVIWSYVLLSLKDPFSPLASDHASKSYGVTLYSLCSSQNYVYGVYMNDSRVAFYFKTPNQTYTVHSNGNSYSDGRWYKVHVVRGLRNTSLTVRPVGPSDSGAVDHVTIMTQAPVYLPDGEALLFGGKDPNRLASLHI